MMFRPGWGEWQILHCDLKNSGASGDILSLCDSNEHEIETNTIPADIECRMPTAPSQRWLLSLRTQQDTSLFQRSQNFSRWSVAGGVRLLRRLLLYHEGQRHEPNVWVVCRPSRGRSGCCDLPL